MQLQTVLACASFVVAAVAQASDRIAFSTVPTTVQAGVAVNIEWNGGNGSPVTITLQNGTAANLHDVTVLTNGATGNYFTWNPSSSLDNGDNYALNIQQTGQKPNYSGMLTLTGGQTASGSSSASASVSSTTSAATIPTSPSSGGVVVGGSGSSSKNTTTTAVVSVNATATAIVGTGAVGTGAVGTGAVGTGAGASGSAATGTALHRNSTFSSATLSSSAAATSSSAAATTSSGATSTSGSTAPSSSSKSGAVVATASNFALLCAAVVGIMYLG